MKLVRLLVACVVILCISDRGLSATTITIETGAKDRVEAPVRIELPAEALKGVVGVVETTGGKRLAVPAQLEPVTDAAMRGLWLIPPNESAAGSTRTFELVVADGIKRSSAAVELSRNDEATTITFAGKPVLQYNHVEVKVPEGVDDVFLRSAYIHPLHSPAGKLMTEDFPADHFHHKGIWQAWVNTQFEGRKIDFWNLKGRTGTIRFVKYGPKQAGDVYAGFVAHHEHVDLTQKPQKQVLHETWDVRVFNVGGAKAGYYLVDLTSSQRCASDSPLLLKQYRYGGVGYRGPKDWGKKDYEILTSEGKTYENAHATAARWCIHTGKVGGDDTSIVFMSHPDNPVHPETMRTSGGFGPFFNWAPVQAGDLTLEPDKAYVFRYRFLVADGKVDKEQAEQAWRAFGDPPKVTIR